MREIEIPEGTEGLIFDCDGTLANTMPIHFLAWQKALGENACHYPEELFYGLAGMPARQIIQHLNEKHGLAMEVDTMADEKERLFQECLPQVTPIPEVEAVVRKYFGVLPMALASGGTRTNCTLTVHLLGLKEHLPVIVTCEDVEHGKPAPDVFLEAARRMGVDPAKCVVFEDADLGVQAGHAAGMKVIDVREVLPG